VLNAGVQGYNVHQEADLLRERGSRSSLTAIVIGFYENEDAPGGSGAPRPAFPVCPIGGFSPRSSSTR
jgi:hypothetical protein